MDALMDDMLAFGVPIVLPQALTGPQIIRALQEGEVTVVIGVPRLYRAVRSGARYERTLRLLGNVKKFSPATLSKSGVMVGLGETMDELLAVFRDLADRQVNILTVGQYLRPSKDHLPIARYYTPDEFHFMKAQALAMGFRHVESGPLVRSSYHAHEHVSQQSSALTPQ